MTNRELFLAISDVVKHEIQSVKTELRSDLGKEIQAVRSDLSGEIDSLKSDVSGIRQELDEVKNDLKNVNLKLENDIGHNIRLLSENYVPAAKKYMKESEHLETLQLDMDVVERAVKKHSEVINEHSEILEKHGEQLDKLVKLA